VLVTRHQIVKVQSRAPKERGCALIFHHGMASLIKCFNVLPPPFRIRTLFFNPLHIESRLLFNSFVNFIFFLGEFPKNVQIQWTRSMSYFRRHAGQ